MELYKVMQKIDNEKMEKYFLNYITYLKGVDFELFQDFKCFVFSYTDKFVSK